MSSRKNTTLRGKKGSWREMEKLGRIFEREGRKRGDLNERIIKEILAELRKEREILKFEQRWDLDRVGIDFLVYLINEKLFAIQVKSSPKGEQAHYKKYGITLRYKNKNIPCLVLIINTRHLIDRSDLKNDIEQYISSIN